MKRSVKKLTALAMVFAMVMSLVVTAHATVTATGAAAGDLAAAVSNVTVTSTDTDLNGAVVTFTVGSDYKLKTTNIDKTGYAVDDTAELLTFGTATTGVSVVVGNTSTSDTAATITFDVSDGSEITSDPGGKTFTITLAIADDTPVTPPAASGDTKNNYGKDGADGAIATEGPMPADVINVVVPSASQSANVFDIYLDPHDLLKQTSGARYGTGVSLTGDARMYFKNDATTFTNVSNSLKLINKSNIDIGVGLAVDVDKKSADFSFVAADAVDTTTTGAAMYLALQNVTGEVTKAVAESDTQPYELISVNLKGESSNAYNSDSVFTAASFAFESSADTDAKKALADALAAGAVDVTVGLGNDFTYSATGTLSGYTFATTAQFSGPATADVTIPVTISDATNTVATISVTAPQDQITAIANDSTFPGASEKVTLKVGSAGASAAIDAKIATDSSWYVMKYVRDNADGTPVYEWQIPNESAVTFNELEFKLTGKINNNDAWDQIANQAFSTRVTWDIKKAESTTPSEGDTPAVVDADPTATVTTKITSGVNGEIALTWGSGSGARTKAALVHANTSIAGSAEAPAATMSVSSISGWQFNGLATQANVIFYNTATTDADAITIPVTIKD